MIFHMKRKIFCIALFIVASILHLGCASTLHVASLSREEMISCSEDLTYSDANTKLSLRYRAFVPAASNEKVPLVVFLHGAGQRGDDNVA